MRQHKDNPSSNFIKKNGFQKIGRSIYMESPPSHTPTRPFLRVRTISNRAWARGNNPTWVRAHNRPQTLDFQALRTFTLCKSETLRVYVPTRLRGSARLSMGVRPTPSKPPNL